MSQLALNIRPRPRVLSYGGGVDSFAVLLRLIALGEAPDVVAFVDVSDGSPDRDPDSSNLLPGVLAQLANMFGCDNGTIYVTAEQERAALVAVSGAGVFAARVRGA